MLGPVLVASSRSSVIEKIGGAFFGLRRSETETELPKQLPAPGSPARQCATAKHEAIERHVRVRRCARRREPVDSVTTSALGLAVLSLRCALAHMGLTNNPYSS